MDPKPQVKVVADVALNVLRLSFAGQISGQVLAQAEAEVVAALQSFHPGFSLLTDFTDMTSMDLDCMPYLARNMDSAGERGVALVVRVIPDHRKDIGVGIISLFHYPRGLKIITTDTREEAERVLL